jgi:hypothetical protein
MAERTEDSESLAYWRYSPEQWRDFTESERSTNQYEVSDTLTKYLNVIVIGGAIAVVFGLLAGGLPGLLIVLVFVVGFLLVVTIIHQAIRRTAQHGLEVRPGEVWIMIDGVCTNGMWFGWAARDPAWRLRIVRRTTVFTKVGKGIEVLEFKCLGSVPLRGGRVAIDKEWRVPVPAGKETEADAVVTRIMASERAWSEEAQLSPDLGSLGHVFAGDVCSKCGSTVEGVTAFSWQCKN